MSEADHRVEPADGDVRQDPLNSIRGTPELRAINDAYRMHGELLEEQRSHLRAIMEGEQITKGMVEDLRKQVEEMSAIVQREKQLEQTQAPPVDTKPPGGKHWGGPGF